MWSFLKDVLEGKDHFDQQMTDTFLLCTTCEKCDIVCQLDLPIEPTWGLLRGNLVQERGFGTKVELVEMGHSKEDGLCCGSVLTRIGEPHPTSEKLGAKRIGEAEATGADALLALCPCCQFQLRVSANEKGVTGTTT
jgi:Fe-S oxidoreductase